MQRITTPTREVDKHGLGKDGFKGGGPPDATQLEPEWFDNMQEEVANVIEGQGVVLDGLILDQLKQVLDDYTFDSPTVTGDLEVQGILTVFDTLDADMDVSLGTDETHFGTFNLNMTAGNSAAYSHALNGDVSIGFDATNLLTILADVGGFTFDAGAQVVGNITSEVGMGTLQLLSGAAAPASPGQMAVDLNNDFIVRTDDGLRGLFYGQSGTYVELEEDDVPVTGLAATHNFGLTFQTAIGNVRVTVWGEVQRASAGNVRLSIQEDQGIATFIDIDNDGVTFIDIESKDDSTANDWTPFKMSRTFGAGVDTTFRGRMNATGGSSCRIREAHLKVRRIGTG